MEAQLNIQKLVSFVDCIDAGCSAAVVRYLPLPVLRCTSDLKASCYPATCPSIGTAPTKTALNNLERWMRRDHVQCASASQRRSWAFIFRAYQAISNESRI